MCRWCQLPRGIFLLPRMPRDRSTECAQKLTTCHTTICGFPTRQACGKIQVTCDMYRMSGTHMHTHMHTHTEILQTFMQEYRPIVAVTWDGPGFSPIK